MKDWTIMIYMAGDNNLSEEMITQLVGLKNAMGMAGSDKFLNIVAVYDSGYPSVWTRYYSFTEANSGKPLEESTVEFVHPQERYRDRDRPGEKTYVIDFVRWAAENWPAKNYALILSGHSDGVIGRTILKDSNPSTALNLLKLDEILRKAARWLVGDNKKFALLGFDSCMMNMVEVGYQFRDLADVMVGSEGNIPSSGWSYGSIFGAILSDVECLNRGLTARRLAGQIVEVFHDHSANYNIGGRSVGISACDMTALGGFVETIDGLAKSLLSYLNAPIATTDASGDQLETNMILKQRIKELIQLSHYSSQTYMYEQSIDIVDFVNALSQNCDRALIELRLLAPGDEKSGTFRALETALKDVKTNCGYVSTAAAAYTFSWGVNGAEYQFSNGVSIFFPWTSLAFELLDPIYKKLNLSELLPNWRQFLGTITELTYRPLLAPLFEAEKYHEWQREVEKLQNLAVNFRTVEARTVDARTVDARTVEARTVEARTVEARTVEARTVDARTVDARTVDARTVDARTVDARTVDARDLGLDSLESVDLSGFLQLFRKFRNHPIDHRVDRRSESAYGD